MVDFFELGDKILVQYRFDIKDQQTELYSNLETHNVSIGIAAAITAYARIHMSQFKNNPDFNLYYSDTDSIYIDKPLPEEMRSNTILGKMKLEYILKNAIFLAPKVYYLETEDGKIKIREDLYTLKVTDNKRKLIYNQNNKFINTIPYIINKDKEIINQ